jgi:NADH-quinone oxidoreductase subunit E
MTLTEKTRAEAREIIARYPKPRSALLPMLHLVQSEEGYVSPEGIALCAEELGLTKAEVGAVATFYTMYRRRPAGTYHVGVCTNTLCAIMGGDAIMDALKEHLGIGHNETTEDGTVSLEHVECNAACDYAPVVMVNWEFYDDQTPGSARELVDACRAGTPPPPTRGPSRLCTFKEVSRVLAGFNDGLGGEGVQAGPATLAGLEIARERGDVAPAYPGQRDAGQPAEQPADPPADQPQGGQLAFGDEGRD